MRRNNPSRCITTARQIKTIFASNGSLGDIEKFLSTLLTEQEQKKYINTLMTRIIRAIPATKDNFQRLLHYVENGNTMVVAIERLCKEGKGLIDERKRIELLQAFDWLVGDVL